MTQDEIIEMARQAGLGYDEEQNVYIANIDDLQDFAKLVAKHTLMNIDPSKFISWQEGFEAGRFAELEACAKVARQISDKYAHGYYGNEVDTADEIEAAIRARGEA